MRLAGADGPREDQILGRGDPLAARERVDLGRVDAIGGGEVEGVERLYLREARLAEALADYRLVPRGLLGTEDLVEIVFVRPVGIPRLSGQASNARATPGNLRARVWATTRSRTIAGRSCAHLDEPPVVVGGAAARDLEVTEMGRDGVRREAPRVVDAGVSARSSGVPATSADRSAGTTTSAPCVSSWPSTFANSRAASRGPWAAWS